jgi:ABC-2 type transport system ATP-binding protein
VISTAYLDEAERCNRLTLLHAGHALYCDTPATLKQRMPGALIAISSTAGRDVRTALSGLPGVSSALLVGDGVHAMVDDADARIPELQNALRLAGVSFSAIAVATPSIEDVFVALLETGGAS